PGRVGVARGRGDRPGLRARAGQRRAPLRAGRRQLAAPRPPRLTPAVGRATLPSVELVETTVTVLWAAPQAPSRDLVPPVSASHAQPWARSIFVRPRRMLVPRMRLLTRSGLPGGRGGHR